MCVFHFREFMLSVCVWCCMFVNLLWIYVFYYRCSVFCCRICMFVIGFMCFVLVLCVVYLFYVT